MSEPVVTIVADDREAAGGVIAALRGRADVSLSIARLPLGDYKVDSAILFERKTVRDFAASVEDGRLFNQVKRLASSPLKSALVIEGTSADMAATGMRREALQGALICVSIIFGLPVLRAMDADETARLMVYTARQIARLGTQGTHRAGYRPKGRRKRQLFLLQGLPGVGPDRAARLLDHFGSVEAVYSADKEDLLGVAGVGRTTAEKIRWILQEGRQTYGARR